MTDEWLNMVEQEANSDAPKIYCATCVHLRRGREQFLCLHPNAVTTTENFLRAQRCYGDPGEHNAHNDCADYERATVRGQVRAWFDHWNPIPLLVLGVVLGVLALLM